MKTYLVTGGAGFIGSNFVAYLLDQHPDCRVVTVDILTYAGSLENLTEAMVCDRHEFRKIDICDEQAIGSLFEEFSFDYVVNFAAESHVDRSIEDPSIFLRTNVGGTLVLLNAARGAWELPDGSYDHAKRFLQVSTDEVYGSLGSTGFFTEETPLNPHSPYSASKASADMFVQAYADTYGLPVNITRCSNNYGPYQFPEKLIPLMIHRALNHESLPVYGDGLNVRDWLYVEDHCAAIDSVLEHGESGAVYNVGGHNELSNIDLVKTVLAYLHNHVDQEIDESLITYVTDRKGHDRRYGIDPRKISEAIGWSPQTKFAAGIERTIQWYIAQSDWSESAVRRLKSSEACSDISRGCR